MTGRLLAVLLAGCIVAASAQTVEARFLWPWEHVFHHRVVHHRAAHRHHVRVRRHVVHRRVVRHFRVHYRIVRKIIIVHRISRSRTLAPSLPPANCAEIRNAINTLTKENLASLLSKSTAAQKSTIDKCLRSD